MKIYTIADGTNEYYGHGSYGTELRICRQNPYGIGDFPPAFKTREGAQKYLDGIKWYHDKKVVELELRDDA